MGLAYSSNRVVLFLLLLLFNALAHHLVDCTSFLLGDDPAFYCFPIFENFVHNPVLILVEALLT